MPRKSSNSMLPDATAVNLSNISLKGYQPPLPDLTIENETMLTDDTNVTPSNFLGHQSFLDRVKLMDIAYSFPRGCLNEKRKKKKKNGNNLSSSLESSMSLPILGDITNNEEKDASNISSDKSLVNESSESNTESFLNVKKPIIKIRKQLDDFSLQLSLNTDEFNSSEIDSKPSKVLKKKNHLYRESVNMSFDVSSSEKSFSDDANKSVKRKRNQTVNVSLDSVSESDFSTSASSINKRITRRNKVELKKCDDNYSDNKSSKTKEEKVAIGSRKISVCFDTDWSIDNEKSADPLITCQQSSPLQSQELIHSGYTCDDVVNQVDQKPGVGDVLNENGPQDESIKSANGLQESSDHVTPDSSCLVENDVNMDLSTQNESNTKIQDGEIVERVPILINKTVYLEKNLNNVETTNNYELSSPISNVITSESSLDIESNINDNAEKILPGTNTLSIELGQSKTNNFVKSLNESNGSTLSEDIIMKALKNARKSVTFAATAQFKSDSRTGEIELNQTFDENDVSTTNCYNPSAASTNVGISISDEVELHEVSDLTRSSNKIHNLKQNLGLKKVSVCFDSDWSVDESKSCDNKSVNSTNKTFVVQESEKSELLKNITLNKNVTSMKELNNCSKSEDETVVVEKKIKRLQNLPKVSINLDADSFNLNVDCSTEVSRDLSDISHCTEKSHLLSQNSKEIDNVSNYSQSTNNSESSLILRLSTGSEISSTDSIEDNISENHLESITNSVTNSTLEKQLGSNLSQNSQNNTSEMSIVANIVSIISKVAETNSNNDHATVKVSHESNMSLDNAIVTTPLNNHTFGEIEITDSLNRLSNSNKSGEVTDINLSIDHDNSDRSEVLIETGKLKKAVGSRKVSVRFGNDWSVDETDNEQSKRSLHQESQKIVYRDSDVENENLTYEKTEMDVTESQVVNKTENINETDYEDKKIKRDKALPNVSIDFGASACYSIERTSINYENNDKTECNSTVHQNKTSDNNSYIAEPSPIKETEKAPINISVEETSTNLTTDNLQKKTSLKNYSDDAHTVSDDVNNRLKTKNDEQDSTMCCSNTPSDDCFKQQYVLVNESNLRKHTLDSENLQNDIELKNKSINSGSVAVTVNEEIKDDVVSVSSSESIKATIDDVIQQQEVTENESTKEYVTDPSSKYLTKSKLPLKNSRNDISTENVESVSSTESSDKATDDVIQQEVMVNRSVREFHTDSSSINLRNCKSTLENSRINVPAEDASTDSGLAAGIENKEAVVNLESVSSTESSDKATDDVIQQEVMVNRSVREFHTDSSSINLRNCKSTLENSRINVPAEDASTDSGLAAGIENKEAVVNLESVSSTESSDKATDDVIQEEEVVTGFLNESNTDLSSINLRNCKPTLENSRINVAPKSVNSESTAGMENKEVVVNALSNELSEPSRDDDVIHQQKTTLNEPINVSDSSSVHLRKRKSSSSRHLKSKIITENVICINSVSAVESDKKAENHAISSTKAKNEAPNNVIQSQEGVENVNDYDSLSSCPRKNKSILGTSRNYVETEVVSVDSGSVAGIRNKETGDNFENLSSTKSSDPPIDVIQQHQDTVNEPVNKCNTSSFSMTLRNRKSIMKKSSSGTLAKTSTCSSPSITGANYSEAANNSNTGLSSKPPIDTTSKKLKKRKSTLKSKRSVTFATTCMRSDSRSGEIELDAGKINFDKGSHDMGTTLGLSIIPKENGNLSDPLKIKRMCHSTPVMTKVITKSGSVALNDKTEENHVFICPGIPSRSLRNRSAGNLSLQKSKKDRTVDVNSSNNLNNLTKTTKGNNLSNISDDFIQDISVIPNSKPLNKKKMYHSTPIRNARFLSLLKENRSKSKFSIDNNTKNEIINIKHDDKMIQVSESIFGSVSDGTSSTLSKKRSLERTENSNKEQSKIKRISKSSEPSDISSMHEEHLNIRKSKRKSDELIQSEGKRTRQRESFESRSYSSNFISTFEDTGITEKKVAFKNLSTTSDYSPPLNNYTTRNSVKFREAISLIDGTTEDSLSVDGKKSVQFRSKLSIVDDSTVDSFSEKNQKSYVLPRTSLIDNLVLERSDGDIRDFHQTNNISINPQLIDNHVDNSTNLEDESINKSQMNDSFVYAAEVPEIVLRENEIDGCSVMSEECSLLKKIMLTPESQKTQKIAKKGKTSNAIKVTKFKKNSSRTNKSLILDKWVSPVLIKFLNEKLMDDDLDYILKTERVVSILCSAVKAVENLDNVEDVDAALLPLKNILIKYQITSNAIEYYTFILKFTPSSFQRKSLPLAGYFNTFKRDTDFKIKLTDPIPV